MGPWALRTCLEPREEPGCPRKQEAAVLSSSWAASHSWEDQQVCSERLVYKETTTWASPSQKGQVTGWATRSSRATATPGRPVRGSQAQPCSGWLGLCPLIPPPPPAPISCPPRGLRCCFHQRKREKEGLIRNLCCNQALELGQRVRSLGGRKR